MPLSEGTEPDTTPAERTASIIQIPTVALNNGIEMPVLQLGTAQLVTIPGRDPVLPPNFVGMLPDRSYRQIQLALEQGVRAFDTAHIYRSPRPMGVVLGSWWQTGQLPNRQSVWLTSKVFHPDATDSCFGSLHMPSMHHMTPDQISLETQRHFEANLTDLGVGYVDLMLLHWPSGEHGTEQENRQRRLAAWRVLERAYSKGWARAIGVSNFSVAHLEQLQEDGAEIVPAVNQIEASATLQYPDILQYCRSRGIVPQAFSPMGRRIQELPLRVREMADKYGKDVGQVVFRYLVQLGYAVVYFTNSKERMSSNTDIFDFQVSDEDMRTLQSLNRQDGGWGLTPPNQLK